MKSINSSNNNSNMTINEMAAIIAKQLGYSMEYIRYAFYPSAAKRRISPKLIEIVRKAAIEQFGFDTQGERNMTRTCTCVRCGKQLETRTGGTKYCLDCRKIVDNEQKRAWRENNHERQLKYTADWQKKHPEKAREYSKNRREKLKMQTNKAETTTDLITFASARKAEMMKMRAEGCCTTEIAKAVGVTPTYVSQVLGHQPKEITLAARQRRSTNHFNDKKSKEESVKAMQENKPVGTILQMAENDLMCQMNRALTKTADLKQELEEAIKTASLNRELAEEAKKRAADAEMVAKQSDKVVEDLQQKLKSRQDMMDQIKRMLQSA